MDLYFKKIIIKKWFYNNKSCVSSYSSQINIPNSILSITSTAAIAARYAKKE